VESSAFDDVMCGIAVLVAFKEKSIHPSLIQLMTDIIRHRGPDDEGFALFDNNAQEFVYGGQNTPKSVFMADLPYAPTVKVSDCNRECGISLLMGHRRLSIVDLSPAGHQPLCYDNNRYWITYNGEIYNWREIRKKLESFGHRFISDSDTEVILAAYAQWGAECLKQFNGMWAFVIFDKKTGTLFAARDRFGVKPLYYWISPEGFLAFASEIKQFTVLPGWKPLLNGPRAYDYLVWGLIDHTPETLFSGVYQIRGGQSIEINIGNIPVPLPVFQWYELSSVPYEGTFGDATKDFYSLMRDSVRLRLRADVSVGSCLSGGLDSSSIVCLVQDILKTENKMEMQKTFSACSDIRRFDEREFIDEVVLSRNIDAHYSYPDPDNLLMILGDIVWHQDEPFGSTSIFAQWMVFESAAKNQVKVMLDGQGADEQLCGYRPFVYRYAELFRHGKFVTLFREMFSAEKYYGLSVPGSLAKTGYLFIPDSVKDFVRKNFLKKTYHPFWLNEDALGARSGQRYFDIPQVKNINALSRLEIFRISLPMLLHWEDRDSMAHSIEARVPFLDCRLVVFLASLPEDYKLKNACTKLVLRTGMKGILPEKIRLRRDKLGFVTAEEEWLRKRRSAEFRDLLCKAVGQSQGVLNDQIIEQFDRIVSGQEPFSYHIWRCICFGQWMKQFDILLPDNACLAD